MSVGTFEGERLGEAVRCEQSPGLRSSKSSTSVAFVSWPERHRLVSESQPQFTTPLPPESARVPTQSAEQLNAVMHGSVVGELEGDADGEMDGR